MQTFFRLLPPRRIFYLRENKAVKELPAEVFGNVTFDCVWISDTAVEKVHPSAFLPSKDHLQDLQIAGSRLKDFPFSFLPRMRRLRVLALANNSLTSIPALNSLSLRRLKLGYNDIATVESDGWNTPHLKHLDLGMLRLT